MKKELNLKIQKVCSSSVLLIVSIITLWIGIWAIGKTVFFNLVINFANENCFAKPDNIFFNIFSVILVIGLIYLLYKKILPKINSKILLILTITFSLFIGFWWINYLRLEPVADQYMTYYCANKILEGDLKSILEPGNYLNRNPHQLGFILYLAGIFKVFNFSKVILIQNFNVIYSAICAITLYLIVKELFEEEIIHKLALLLITFFSIYFMFFSPHVYGNIHGLMYGLIAILFTLKYTTSNKTSHLIITTLSIAFAYLLKSNYEIFLIAIIIHLILKTIQEINIKAFIGTIFVILAVFGVKAITYTCFENITGYSLKTGVPTLSYIYMGIAEPQTLNPGWYTGEVETIYNESGYDKEKAKEITKEKLTNRINHLKSEPGYTYGYFRAKLRTTWLNPTFQTIWCSTPGVVLDQDPSYNNYICRS